jgi:hypothetical protein
MVISSVPGLLLAGLLAAGAAPSSSRKQPVQVVYEAPKKPEHAAVAEKMRRERLLEDSADMLAMLKLPKLLTLRAETCGESNAWYDSETHVLTFCYELVSDFIKMAENSGHFELTPDQAVVGPFLFIVLHETAHAVIHILAVPVLGQEEDAADQMAVLAATHFGGDFAERMLRAAAFMYDHDSRARKPGEADFADVHGLDRQRFYNVLCLAWGADPKLYDFAKDLGKLPDERAEWCREEYQQVLYAERVLIRQHVDDKEVQRVRAKFARSKFAR